ncbi:MAG TPA: serpin family protein [Bacillota bacterium]|nr:serpin family protein [Bacillota bacterium]HPZ21740.1 serpin family protein [Bacillota bacterium]HQD19214.1 serpin family protein [Bacillota bacterium]
MNRIKKAVCILVLGLIALNLTACAPKVQAADLMAGITGNKVQGKAADDRFIGNTADFSLELFKRSVAEKENSLVSPLSVLLALAMTANGADSETLAEMEAVLGKDISLEDLNEYLYTYVKHLPSEKNSRLSIANSIWFRDDENRFTVERDFLQKNADYYNAAAYKAPFDNQTLKDINTWVQEKTENMIDKILDEINEDAVMYLINAILFEAEWQQVYNKANIREGEFTAVDGDKEQAEFMYSEENIYLESDQAAGFIKPYAGNYSFAALLPSEGIAIEDFIQGLTGDEFMHILDSAENTAVNAGLPKFSYAYTIQMNEVLKDMGMPLAFSAKDADFSRLGRSSRGNLFIGEVLHKTFIQVDERGTKAGAVTKVEIRDEAYYEVKNVVLDRPFIYAIIDNDSKLPLFIGSVMQIAD